MSSTPEQNFYALLADKLIANFAKRQIEGYYCETGAEALEKALELIPVDSVVACGGSATLLEIGLPDALADGGYTFIDPSKASGARDMEAAAREALCADYFLMSSNAIAASGELVNADGFGNRVSALIFGPKNVLIIAGMNKITPTLESAVLRVKTHAAPMCLVTFGEYDTFDQALEEADRACAQMVITGMSTVKGRIKVILVGEALGY